MTDFDCAIVGAGVIGLAVARELATRRKSVLILERHRQIGFESSSRNSEVIHAGIYYPARSRKAVHCLRGREWLYRFLESRNVPHRRCGKLIVATSSAQADRLSEIEQAGRANGVTDLAWLSQEEVADMEPAVRAHTALFSPSTGIFDTHAYMLALLGEAEEHGAQLVLDTNLDRVERVGDAWSLWIAGHAEPAAKVGSLVNAAGLGSVDVARSIVEGPAPHFGRLRYAKGTYFSYGASVPFSRLVYPVPEPGGLGIHLTLDLAGRARFGPNVEWVEQPDFTPDPALAPKFAEAIRTYWPDVAAERLQPDYAGVRPKIVGPNDPAPDFLIEGPATHGTPGLVHLHGIESPGLTASLSIAEEVADLIEVRA